MRISDWSSDVCSSDLCIHVRAQVACAERAIEPDRQRPGVAQRIPECLRSLRGQGASGAVGAGAGGHHRHPCPDRCDRSEEHTSELPSLMRISYAVFCLKNKKAGKENNWKTRTDT